jgi:hypothetical protein
VGLAPAAITLVAGSASPPFTLQVSNLAGADLAFVATLPPAIVGHVTVDPHPVRIPPGSGTAPATATFRVVTAPTTPAGTYSLALREPTFGLNVSLTLVVQPAVTIQAVAPQTLVSESIGTTLRLLGEGFLPGASLASEDPTLVFGPVRVLSERLLEANVSVRADARPGRRELRLVNPNGASASTSVVVLPADALTAPLAVRTVAVLYPVAGGLYGMDESVRPRGVLAVSGTGTLTGTWQLDGVPFERFVVQAHAGLPVQVEASLPIPRTALGEHRLELAIESPRASASAAVPLVLVTTRASSLRLLAPRDGAVLGRPTAVFRWSAVPGAEGYEMEVVRARSLPVRHATAEPRWEAQAGSLQPGVHRWSVRPIFPGGVRGEPTVARRIAVLPDAVELRLLPAANSRRSSLRWEGGSPGLLYRVDFLTPANGPFFSALAARPSYALPDALAARLPHARARVTALAPGGVPLGHSATVELPPPTARLERVVASPLASVTSREPALGASVTTAHPTLRAAWNPAVTVEQTALVLDDVDVTALAVVGDRSIQYQSVLALAPGEHVVSLVLGDAIERWTFRVADGTTAEGPATPAPAWESEATAPRKWADWQLSPSGMVTFATGDDVADEWTGRASLSGQVDADGAHGFLRAAGDLSAATHGNDPAAGSSPLENRNWTITGGPRHGRFRGEATLGYQPPSFLAGTELVSAGLPRGGAQATLAGPAVRLSGYQTFDSDFAGVVTGSFAPAQRLRAAGLTVGAPEGRLGVRLLFLDTEEEKGGLSAGGEGTVYGLVGTFRPHPAWTLLVEGARGELRPAAGSFEEERNGFAFRFGVTGNVGSWGVRLNLRDTDPGFVNPANRGLTPGGIADRTGGEVELSRALGSSYLSLAYSLLESGAGLGLGTRGRQQRGQANLSLALGTVASLSLGGSYGTTRSDGEPELTLPAGDQTDRALQLQVNETLLGFSIAQSAAYQLTEDRLDPSRRSEMTSGGLSLARVASGALGFFAQAMVTRMEGDPAFGRTDSLLVAVQPSLRFARLSFLPYVSFSRARNDLLATDIETASYQVAGQWNPRWFQSLLSLHASADWTRTTIGTGPTPGFAARYTLSLVLRRDLGAARPLAAPMTPAAGPAVPGLRSALSPVRGSVL